MMVIETRDESSVEEFDCLSNAGGSGLQGPAYARWRFAQTRTEWGRSHICRLALTEEGVLLASATRYLLSGILDGKAVGVCALADLTSEAGDDEEFVRTLVTDAVADAAARRGAAVALLFGSTAQPWHDAAGFVDITPFNVELNLLPTSRPGAPMVSVRAGEDRDLPAIVEMGRIRAAPFRFHLDRDVDFVKHVIVRQRLLAGLGSAGAQELQFFVTEEGTIATAYVVLRVRGSVWTILECGDRDPSGARVGAVLQALLARDPASTSTTIRGWLPEGFTPVQARRVTLAPAAEVMASLIGAHRTEVPLAAETSLYWVNDRL